MGVNEGILSKDFPQPSLGHFRLGDDEGVQLIIFIILSFVCVCKFPPVKIYHHLIASIFHVFLHSAKRIKKKGGGGGGN